MPNDFPEVGVQVGLRCAHPNLRVCLAVILRANMESPTRALNRLSGQAGGQLHGDAMQAAVLPD